MQSFRARMDQGAMAIQEYSAFPKARALMSYPEHLQRCSRCILQSDLTREIWENIRNIELEIYGKIETIQVIGLLKSDGTLQRILEYKEGLLSLKLITTGMKTQ